jgi:hypothetical protein
MDAAKDVDDRIDHGAASKQQISCCGSSAAFNMSLFRFYLIMASASFAGRLI